MSMSILSQVEVTRVIDILASRPAWSSENSRRNFLTLALFGVPLAEKIVNDLDFSGARSISAQAIVMALTTGDGATFLRPFLGYLLRDCVNPEDIQFLTEIEFRTKVTSATESSSTSTSSKPVSDTLTSAQKAELAELALNCPTIISGLSQILAELPWRSSVQEATSRKAQVIQVFAAAEQYRDGWEQLDESIALFDGGTLSYERFHAKLIEIGRLSR